MRPCYFRYCYGIPLVSYPSKTFYTTMIKKQLNYRVALCTTNILAVSYLYVTFLRQQ